MALQGYTDQPCPQWDSNPQPQYMSWPWITPDSRCLNPLGHHDQDCSRWEGLHKVKEGEGSRQAGHTSQLFCGGKPGIPYKK